MVSATFPTILPSSLDAPFYRGSVQNLYAMPERPEWMVSETTEAGSVFDVGSIFKIAGSDITRTLFRHVLFGRLARPETWQNLLEKQVSRSKESLAALEKLAKTGVRTHHLGIIDAVSGEVATEEIPPNPGVYTVVERFGTKKPRLSRFFKAIFYDYGIVRQPEGLMIPLEYLVRFGITSASSIYKKYQALSPLAQRDYLVSVGRSEPLQPWTMWPEPTLDFSTKYEPEDRALSVQEAALVSGLSGEGLLATAHCALLGGEVVREMLGELGLTLWDLKWEFAWRDGEPVFVDTVDTDSVRATLPLEYQGRRFYMHCNKQAMRDYYQLAHPEWVAGIQAAKTVARQRGVPFKEELAAGQNEGRYAETPVVDEVFLALQSAKMQAIEQWLLGKTNGDQTAQILKALAHNEILFYEQCGLLEGLHRINGDQTFSTAQAHD